MAKDSRKEPPRWAVTTIMPALGGASRMSFQSSVEKSAFVVIARLRSLPPQRGGWGQVTEVGPPAWRPHPLPLRSHHDVARPPTDGSPNTRVQAPGVTDMGVRSSD